MISMIKNIFYFLAIGLFGGGILYYFWPEKEPFNLIEAYVIEKAISQLVEQVPLQEEDPLVWVLTLRGDEKAVITQTLLKTLDRSGKVKVLPKTELEELLQKNKLNPLLFASSKDAQILLERFQVGGIFVGEITGFLRKPEKTQIDLQISLIKKKPTPPLHLKTSYLLEQNFFSFQYLLLYFSSFSLGAKIFLYLIGVCLLPLASFFMIRFLLEQNHNLATLFGLMGYAFVDVGWVVLLFGGVPITWYGAFLFLGLIGLAIFYNYGIFTEIKDLI